MSEVPSRFRTLTGERAALTVNRGGGLLERADETSSEFAAGVLPLGSSGLSCLLFLDIR
jgi:hypothetical protein